jgi:hypothetical protein
MVGHDPTGTLKMGRIEAGNGLWPFATVIDTYLDLLHVRVYM